VPAGTARLTDLLWLDRKLFVSPLSKAKLAKRVPEEIGKSLNPDIRAALAYAFERSPDDIKAYLEENFTLAPEAMVVTDQDGPAVQDNADPISPSMLKADDVSGESVVSESDAVGGEDGDDMPASPPSDDDEADNDDMRDPEDEPDVVSRPRPAPKPPRPNIMARFALAQGYRADGDDRFFHADGSWISRANATKFPWERRSSSGELQCHYYPKEHCLEREPLQIEADIWGLVDQKPEIYSFILLNPEGAPVEMTGSRLRALRDGGEMTIHPATYRLVYDLDQ
jgi:hypothetical protein